MVEERDQLKEISEEASNTASLYFDANSFGNGYIKFTDEKANKKLYEIIEANLKLDGQKIPQSSYYSQPIDYYIYYFDDSGYMRAYKNNAKTEVKEFSYGSFFKEPLTKKDIKITTATCIVTIDAKNAKMRLGFLQNKAKLIQTSAYEYKVD